MGGGGVTQDLAVVVASRENSLDSGGAEEECVDSRAI